MKITDYIVKFLYILCIAAITGLTLIVFIQVFSRFIKFSLPGTEELARLLVVWLTFLGSSLAIYEKMHLAVNFFVGLTSEKNQKRIHVFVHFLMMVFFGVLAFYGFKLTFSAMTTTSSTLQLPMGIFYVAIPLSALFSLYFLFINMLNPSIKGGEPEL
ncbi:TRAP transporter small permease [Pseudogracilibacillus sp. SE30717A]|uniref:TRAP transporter small permease n=1 Tax=Pseudogracilibacillus sp. SE30717A TaxID=3098293 RepID=UPI00300E428C